MSAALGCACRNFGHYRALIHDIAAERFCIMSCHLQPLVLAVLLITVPPAMGQGSISNNVTTSELKSDSLPVPGISASKSHRTSAAPTLLASSLMGQTLYARDGKRIGEISDVVLTRDLDSLLAIVGIGGFLGFGTRDVAIPKERIAVSEDESGELRFTVATTREQLQEAPVFDRTVLMR